MSTVAKSPDMSRLKFNPLWTVFNFANGIAIYYFLLRAKDHGTPTARDAVYVFAPIFCFCAIFALFVQQMRFDRKQRIAESLDLLRWAFLDLRTALH